MNPHRKATAGHVTGSTSTARMREHEHIHTHTMVRMRWNVEKRWIAAESNYASAPASSIASMTRRSL